MINRWHGVGLFRPAPSTDLRGRLEPHRAVLDAAALDAGSGSEANAASETEGCELFIAAKKDHQQRAAPRDR